LTKTADYNQVNIGFPTVERCTDAKIIAFGNLVDSLARKFHSKEALGQFHLALTDTFIKYALTTLPEVQRSLVTRVSARMTKVCKEVNTTAREFQRLMQSDAYSSSFLDLRKTAATPRSQATEA